MKRNIIVIITFFCLSSNLYGQQQRDFIFFKDRIDSLTQIYSTKEWQEMIYGNYFDNTNLSVKEKKELIVKVRELFEQEEYANLYRYGHRIIYDMWAMRPNNNSLEIKAKLIELYLQYYFYPESEKIIYCYPDWDYPYYSKKARNLLAEIVENKKTEKEYDAWLNFEKSLPSNISISEKLAKELMKKWESQNDTVIKQLRDSIYLKRIYDGVEKNLESLQIEPDMIRMIGLLDMNECIPVLKQNLQLCIQNKCHEKQIQAYRYALARLGDKEQFQYIIDHLMNNDYSGGQVHFHGKDFSYFKNDEMIWKYLEFNFNSGKRIFDGTMFVPAKLQTMGNVYLYIKNLPKELEYPNFKDGMEGELKWAQSLYEWLIANKDTVEFDYEGEKRIMW